jgi:hypothetical protein
MMMEFPAITQRLASKAIPIMITVLTISLVASITWEPNGLVEGRYAVLNVNLPPMNLTLIGLTGTQLSLNETDIGNLTSYESWGGYKNSLGNIKGLGNYTGVPLITLCDLVGGITGGSSLRVIAMDNYTVTLSYGQVVNGDFITFDNQTGQQVTHHQSLTPILAYYYDSENVTDGPLRLAIVGPEGLATDSSFWVKYVVKLEILSVGVHDVAVTDVVSPKCVVGQTLACNVSVTVANLGDYSEALNVLLYASSTFVGTWQNLALANSTSTTITFTWNTTGVAYGNYTIWAYISPVPGETDTRNNNCTDGWIIVARVGDLTGGSASPWDFVPDGKCDGKDIAVAAKCFGSYPGCSPPLIWNANCDVNNDGKVDGKDIATVARHFGE